jgi:hypothetical protein
MKPGVLLSPQRIAQLRAGPAMRVGEAIQIYPFSRNKIYELIAAGLLAYRKVGKTTLLSTPSLEALASPEDTASG